MKQGRMRVEIPLQRWLVIPSHVIPSVDEGEDEGCVGEEVFKRGKCKMLNGKCKM